MLFARRGLIRALDGSRIEGAYCEVIYMPIAEHLVKQFHREGYLILKSVISEEDLTHLNAECQRNLDKQVADMERVGAETLGLTQKEKRYFLTSLYEESPFLKQFLYCDQMIDIVGSLVGDTAFLFLELFVVKWPRTGTPLAWHQDSGYLMGNPHRPFVALWCALDDMTEENGALHVLPYEHIGSKEVIEHVKDKRYGDLVGYHGEDPGVALPVPRGSIIALSSTTFHCSGANTTDVPRRAYLVSYSPEPITDKNGRLWNRAVPFIKNGRRVEKAGTTDEI